MGNGARFMNAQSTSGLSLGGVSHPRQNSRITLARSPHRQQIHLPSMSCHPIASSTDAVPARVSMRGHCVQGTGPQVGSFIPLRNEEPTR